MTSMDTSGLPIVNIGLWEHGTPEEKAAVLAQVKQIIRDPGFLYVAGHGIDEAELAETQAAARRFFALPQAEKDAVSMVNSPHFRGYTRAGLELTRGQPDWREQFDIGAERTVIAEAGHEPAWLRTQGLNQWPEAQPELRAVLLRYQNALSDLSYRLLKLVAVALGQPETAFDPFIGDTPGQAMKIIRYPGRHDTDSDQGVGPHKDGSFFAFVLQDEVGGFEALVGDKWVAAPPIPGTFVVNIGETLELATNGYLHGTVHQVVTPPSGIDRLSIAFFFGPKLDSVVETLPLAPELAEQADGPHNDPLNPLLFEVGPNYLKGRLRSHPDVAERHYADLLAS